MSLSRWGDGTKGWLEKALFDAILVVAGGPSVLASLQEQLCAGSIHGGGAAASSQWRSRRLYRT